MVEIVVVPIEIAEELQEELVSFATPCLFCDGMVVVTVFEDGKLEGVCSNKKCKVNK